MRNRRRPIRTVARRPRLRPRTAEYQGYKNYETWHAALMISNDYGLYSYFNEVIEDLKEDRDYGSERKDPNAYNQLTLDLADTMESFWEEQMPELDDFFGPLLSSAWQEIDWREVAEDFLAE